MQNIYYGRALDQHRKYDGNLCFTLVLIIFPSAQLDYAEPREIEEGKLYENLSV